MARSALLLLIFFLLSLILLPIAVFYGLKMFKPPVQVKTGEKLIRVYFHETGITKTMPLEEYVVGVVAAEMPAHFEMEALKAQAVAARTYALKRMQENPSHPGADVCTDPNHCQAYLDDGDLRKKWGILNFWRYKSKIEAAVNSTRGLVLTYQGKLVDPAYHANSGGRTEEAVHVWGKEVPYLQSVPSPWDEGDPNYQRILTFTLEELQGKLGGQVLPVAANLPSGNFIEALERTPTGRIKLLRLGNKILPGGEARKLLGLPSTNFTWEVEGNKIHFRVIGYGHGVGMSQYGANGMAREGYDFLSILRHYYPGTEVVQGY